MRKIILILFLFYKFSLIAQNTTTRILFIFDESRSMLGDWNGERKIDVANRVLSDMVDSLAQIPNVQMALRMYGHQKNYPPRHCDDTKLEVPFSPNSAEKIKEKLRTTTPKGTTPIAFSLMQSEKDFPPCKNCKNIIILITDGIEECGADPCKVALSLQRNSVFMQPYIIGLGLDLELKNAFDCMGKYLDAGSEDDFRKIIKTIISQTTLNTTIQVDLLDIYKKATETGINMSFYDQHTGVMKYNFIHTFNELGNSDTLEIDALSNYRIVIHTIPQVVIEKVQLKPGRHNIVRKNAAQGSLIVKQAHGNKYRELKFRIEKSGECKVVNYQNVDMKEKYLVGNYDIEVPTIPILKFKNIKIEQSKLNTLKIPEPGQTAIQMPADGYGSLYQIIDGEAIWVINLNNRLDLNLPILPGKYMAVWRSGKLKKSSYTKIKKFEVKSGYSSIVTF